jgi:signal transduction protein with GAF and PtsI domain
VLLPIILLSGSKGLIMSDQLRYLQQEVSRLQDENRSLKGEVLSLREVIDSIELLSSAIGDLDANTEIMPLLGRILASALAVIHAEDGSLLVLDEETGELVFVLSYGQIPQENLSGIRIPAGKGIAGWVAAHNRPTIVNNASSDDRFYAGIDLHFDFTTNSVLAVPIASEGRVMGVVEVLNKTSGAPFSETDQALLSLLCRFAGDIIQTVIHRDEVTSLSDAGSSEG